MWNIVANMMRFVVDSSLVYVRVYRIALYTFNARGYIFICSSREYGAVRIFELWLCIRKILHDAMRSPEF